MKIIARFTVVLLLAIAVVGCGSNEESVVAPQQTDATQILHSDSLSDETVQAAVDALPRTATSGAAVIAVMEISDGLVALVRPADAGAEFLTFDINVFERTSSLRLIEKYEEWTPCDAFILYMMECLNSCIGAPYCYEWCLSGGDGC